MRSVFSAGLLDGFLEKQFNPFDFSIGVSAGAYTLATYMAGQAGLSLRIFRDIATSKDFISYSRFIRGGHLIDLDWLLREADIHYHLAPEQILHNGKPLYVSLTDVMSGEPVYIKATAELFTQIMKATMALPVLYRDFPVVAGIPMTDGGVADGIPVAEAIRLGATRIMVIRSRHHDYRKHDTLWHKYIRWKLKAYPALQRTLQERVSRFETVINLIRHPPKGVDIIEVCPPDEFHLSRFGQHFQKLQLGYDAGLQLAESIIKRWSASGRQEFHRDG